MAKRTLVLVKHSEPVLEPSVDPKLWRLSERGRYGSVLLGGRLGRYGPGVVVSGEEPKAGETARLAAGRLGVENLTLPDLHEHDRTGVPFLSMEGFDLAPEPSSRGRVSPSGAGRRRSRPSAGSIKPCGPCSIRTTRRWSWWSRTGP